MKEIIRLLKERNPFLSNKDRAELYRDKLAAMGDNCEIFLKVSFGSEPYLIELGDNVRITYGVKFITHDGGIYVLRNLGLCPDAAVYGKIKLGSNIFIGNDAIILPGVEIGDNCVIGAGSIVTKSIPANSIVAGVPAKVLRNIEEYYDGNKPKLLDTLKMNSSEKKQFILSVNDDEKFIKK